MALKATIHKAKVQVSDLDQNAYSDHELTIARHPSETDERMMTGGGGGEIRTLAIDPPMLRPTVTSEPWNTAKDMGGGRACALAEGPHRAPHALD